MDNKVKTVNITVPFSINGKHYNGLSIFPGVDFSLVDAPCGSTRQLISLANAAEGSWPTGIFWDTVSASDDKGGAVSGYLKVKPV